MSFASVQACLCCKTFLTKLNVKLNGIQVWGSRKSMSFESTSSAISKVAPQRPEVTSKYLESGDVS